MIEVICDFVPRLAGVYLSGLIVGAPVCIIVCVALDKIMNLFDRKRAKREFDENLLKIVNDFSRRLK